MAGCIDDRDAGKRPCLQQISHNASSMHLQCIHNATAAIPDPQQNVYIANLPRRPLIVFHRLSNCFRQSKMDITSNCFQKAASLNYMDCTQKGKVFHYLDSGVKK